MEALGGGFDRMAIMASADGLRSGAGAPLVDGGRPRAPTAVPGEVLGSRSRPGEVPLSRSRPGALRGSGFGGSRGWDAGVGAIEAAALGAIERRGTKDSSWLHDEQPAAPIGFHWSHCPQTMPISVRSASKPYLSAHGARGVWSPCARAHVKQAQFLAHRM